jgi:hypothetical protein
MSKNKKGDKRSFVDKISKILKGDRARALLVAAVLACIGVVFLWRGMAEPNPNLPADLNNDSVVNLADMSILLDNYGKATSLGDLNNDGEVTLADLSILLAQYDSHS